MKTLKNSTESSWTGLAARALVAALVLSGMGCDHDSSDGTDAEDAPTSEMTQPAEKPVTNTEEAPAVTPPPSSTKAPAVQSFSGIIEAEKPAHATGGGRIPRGGASGRSVWHLDKGESATYQFSLSPDGKFATEVFYSDDGGGSSITIQIDGRTAGQFRTRSTGLSGFGWNNFTHGPTLALGNLSTGSHTLTLKVQGDPFGVDIDFIRIVER
jgi:hypothetical protein